MCAKFVMYAVEILLSFGANVSLNEVMAKVKIHLYMGKVINK